MVALQRHKVQQSMIVCWAKLELSTQGGARHAWYYEGSQLRMVCGNIGGGRKPKSMTRKTPGQRSCGLCHNHIEPDQFTVALQAPIGVTA